MSRVTAMETAGEWATRETVQQAGTKAASRTLFPPPSRKKTQLSPSLEIYCQNSIFPLFPSLLPCTPSSLSCDGLNENGPQALMLEYMGPSWWTVWKGLGGVCDLIGRDASHQG